jgi:hypothetical protein
VPDLQPQKPSSFARPYRRHAVAALWAAASTPFLLVAVWVPIARAAGLVRSVPIPLLVALGMVAGPALVAAVPRLHRALPASLDDETAPGDEKLAALWLVGALFALFQLGRAAVFLGDPSYVGASVAPDDPFVVNHSCLTAYLHGAILSADPAANVYDMAFVGAAPDASLPATAACFAPFTLDAFGYPPPFLLLPRALLVLTGDFMVQRAWFSAASLALAFFACASAARALGGLAERRMWLLTPLLLASPPVVATIQVGNFHLAEVALCLLCWVALEKRHDGAAGALRAGTTLAKIFPGVLGVLLLVQRRFRAVGATVAAAAALVALSVAVLGTRVWRDFFLYHLPRVQSGEALRFLAESPKNIEFNLAPFGLPFKLAALGIAEVGWPEARAIANLYTVLLLAVAAVAGLCKGSPQRRLTVWLAIVMLASLRSPFAAPFVLCAVTLLMLTMTAEVRSWRAGIAFVVAWALFSLPVALPDPKVAIAVSLARAGGLYAFLLWGALRGPLGRPTLADERATAT